MRGYFLWSLIDNYEWNHGYDLKFGAFGYDIKTKERIVKPMAEVYGAIAEANGLNTETLTKFDDGAMP